LASKRSRLWCSCRPKLRPLPPRVRQHLAGFRTTGRTRRRFSQRYAKRFRRLLGRIQPHLGRYFRMTIEERHAFRRRLRQLRYLRELVQVGHQPARDELLERLVRPQVAMGEVQNLRLVESMLGGVPEPPSRARLGRSLARRTRECEREIREGLRALASGLRG
jgi:hypothetical protein